MLKTYSLHCPTALAQQLAEALTAYAHAAYPAGGSQCTQVAHQTLLDSARELARAAHAGDAAVLRRRQRGIFKAGVAWYFGPEGPGDPQLRAPLLNRLAAALHHE